MRYFPFFLAVFLGLHLAWAAPASEGQSLFQQRCASCHTVGGGRGIGPDLAGVTGKRDRAWLHRWIREPDKMLAEKDSVAVGLLKEFNQVAMPNMGLTSEQTDQVIAYLENQGQGAAAATAADEGAAGGQSAPGMKDRGRTQNIAFFSFLFVAAVIAAVFFWVARSTSDPQPVDMKVAYRFRRILFVSGSMLVMALLTLTIPKSPYADSSSTPDRVIYVSAMQFSFAFTNEPVASKEDMGAQIVDLEISRGSLVEFRVTSLDATHGFAIYNPKGAIFAQTQAMPGYTNRLRVRFDEPGKYPVLCLEYCGAAHHMMKTSFNVR